eukprot:PhF_6_TR37044/c0_g1_i1/m.54209
MSGRIEVYCRIRPEYPGEMNELCHNVIEMMTDSTIVVEGGKQYFVDGTFPASCDQDVVYNRVGKPMLEGVYDGYSSAIMCYGQTGTGKTYTLCSGIIPRAAKDLFLMKSARVAAGESVTISAQMLQLYRDGIYDLLDDTVTTANPSRLDVRFNETEKCVEVPSLRTVRDITSDTQFLQMFQQGMSRRVTCFTKMNSSSSRSHAVLIVHIEIVSGVHTNRGKILFIDLAGYERMTKTDISDPIRKDEAKCINASLLALGHVISSLSAQTSHIPWRNSKLTRLLQDAVGGRSRTSIILTIGPSSDHFHETLGTLYFGSRAMTVQTAARLSTAVDYETLAKQFQEMYANATNQLELMQCQKMAVEMELREVRGRASVEVDDMRSRLKSIAAEMLQRGESKEKVRDFLRTSEEECDMILEQQLEECLIIEESHRLEEQTQEHAEREAEKQHLLNEIERLTTEVESLQEENMALRTSLPMASPRSAPQQILPTTISSISELPDSPAPGSTPSSSSTLFDRIRNTQHIQRLFIENERLQNLVGLLAELHRDACDIALTEKQTSHSNSNSVPPTPSRHLNPFSPINTPKGNIVPTSQLNSSSLSPTSNLAGTTTVTSNYETPAEYFARWYAAAQKKMHLSPGGRRKSRTFQGAVKSSRTEFIRQESEKWTSDDLWDYRAFLSHTAFVLGAPGCGKTSFLHCLLNKPPTIKRLPVVITPTLKVEFTEYNHSAVPQNASLFQRFTMVQGLVPRTSIRFVESSAEHVVRWTSHHMPQCGAVFLLLYNMFPSQEAEDAASDVERYITSLLGHLQDLYGEEIVKNLPIMLVGTHEEMSLSTEDNTGAEEAMLETQRRLRMLREWFTKQPFGTHFRLLENVAISCKNWTVVGERAASPNSYTAILNLIADECTRSAPIGPGYFASLLPSVDKSVASSSLESFWSQWISTPSVKRTPSMTMLYGIVTFFTALRRWLVACEEHVIERRYLLKLMGIHLPQTELHEPIMTELERRGIVHYLLPLGYPMPVGESEDAHHVVAVDGGRLLNLILSGLLFPQCTRRALRRVTGTQSIESIAAVTKMDSFHLDQQIEDDMQLWVSGVITSSAAKNTLQTIVQVFHHDSEMMFRSIVAMDWAPSISFPFIVPMLCEVSMGGVKGFQYLSYLLSCYGPATVMSMTCTASMKSTKKMMAPIQVMLLRETSWNTKSPVLWTEGLWIHSETTFGMLMIDDVSNTIHLCLASPIYDLDSNEKEIKIRHTIEKAINHTTNVMFRGTQVPQHFQNEVSLPFAGKVRSWSNKDASELTSKIPVEIVGTEDGEDVVIQHTEFLKHLVEEKGREWVCKSTVFEDTVRTMGIEP